MCQFLALNEGDLEDGCDSDGELVPFYDSEDGIVKILEDEESCFESLGNLSITITPPEVTTKVLITPYN